MKPSTWHNFTTKSNTPPWVFYTFFKLHNGTKSRNASHKLFLTICKLYKPVLEQSMFKAGSECIFLFSSQTIYLLMLKF